MSSDRSLHAPEVNAALIAEAAAWLAILHGPNRTAAVEQGLSKWLRTSPAHAQAFEQATEIWEESRNLPRRRMSTKTNVMRPLLALAAGIVLAVVGVMVYFKATGVGTDVGEQRALILDDGTRVMLNTATRVVVSYDKQRRYVELKTGEAHFEVAKRPDWPFVVTAGTQQVTALGTAFTVRRDDDRLTVTLVEGKVAVTPRAKGLESLDASWPQSAAITLTPGQRAVFVADHLATLDRADLQRALAWQRREVAFDSTPLLDAVAEMNRYSVTPVAIEASQAGQVRITGLFRAGDSLSFARAVAATYELEVIEEEHRIVLARSRQGGGF